MASPVAYPQNAGPRYDFLNLPRMRIGLSYHGGDSDYDAYPAALERRAQALGIEIATHWLAGAGHEPRLDLLEDLDAIVLTGGPDVEPRRYGFADVDGVCNAAPERDAVEWEILERIEGRPLRMLAICRGSQLLNVFHGGSLIPDLGERTAAHGRSGDERSEHRVRIMEGAALRQIAGSASGRVNSSHHQAVDRLAAGFRAGAVSEDGVIEAFEPARPDGPFMLAVQWHPEAMAPGLPLADGVLDAFLRKD